MSQALDILKRYWGYAAFREKQPEIIEAVLNGQDTLALLPTGGGKSICYQVPGLMQPGLCLVVSPLIALMTDQVNQLKKRGIGAIAITSAMRHREIDIALDNAIYGDTKFLYVSPERLKTRLFKARFEKMNINLIAVDEAHCISEWGYDFRPAYLEIAQLRKLKPEATFLALTATATPDVIDDIQQQLQFKTPHVIRKSFERKNLTYSTFLTTNKRNRIETFLSRHDGSGIIYCATRRGVKALSLFLNQRGFSATHYHAGLDFEERKEKQEQWMRNEIKVIVATNAFGMGIDKPDVRFVLHYDIPATPEAYYQEAGRAGRDGYPAEANLYYEASDVHALEEKIALKFPPITTIKSIYNALGNHFQLAFGSGLNAEFPIDLSAFADKYNQPLIVVYNAIKFLELCGFIGLSEHYKQPSRLRILGSTMDLYQQQVRDPQLNTIVQFILRTEMGAFDDYVTINLFKIAQKTGLSKQIVHQKLSYLTQLELIDYVAKNELPVITYLTERLTDNNLSIAPKFYTERKRIAEEKLAAIIQFIRATTCKSEVLLHYFGETNTQPCGKCISCLNETKTDPDAVLHDLKKWLTTHTVVNENIEVRAVIKALTNHPEKAIITALRQLVEENKVKIDDLGQRFTRF